MKKTFSLLTLLVAMFLYGCDDCQDDIDRINERLDKIEGTTIASIHEQIAGIDASIADLKALDALLQESLGELEAEDLELGEKIAALETYVDGELKNTEDWATATFATLEQYEAIQTEIASIKALIEQYQADITAAYTKAITDAIATSETSMKSWVNEVLADGYYDIAAVDAMLSALETKLTAADAELEEQIADQQAALEQAKKDLAAAYEKAITDAVANNNGVINAAIARAVSVAKDALKEQIDDIDGEITAIKNRLTELENNFANRIQSLTYIPKYTDGKATMENGVVELDFFVTPASVIKNIKEEHLSVKATYTATRAASLVELSVTGLEKDSETISVKVSASADVLQNLVDDGKEMAVFLIVADGNSEFVSDYVPLQFSIMGDIINPSLPKKGDFAMKDGSFISYSENIILTDEQKENVAGIVFWTTADSNTSGSTPAKLTDDKIMAKDFPNCTHGLIVSLKDVSTKTKWQSTCSNIASWQTKKFDTADKNDYKSIASDTGADYPINYILGYQNTKLLEAYNNSLEANSGNTVLPVSLLETWKATNPAPANTTGWFLPSEKELYMLCYKDMDSFWSVNGKDKVDTKTAVNASLDKVGGTQFGVSWYWSSSENVFYGGKGAFAVRFEDAFVICESKDGGSVSYHVRAVCAF